MSYTIIKQNQIPEEDVIVISSGYKPPIKLDYVKESFKDINIGFFKKLGSWNTPKSYDEYIDHLTNGKEFIAYIDLMHIYQRILVTHSKCISFNFIEEGSASYINPSTMGEVTHLFWKMPYRYNNIKDFLIGFRFMLRGYSLRILNMPYWPQSYEFFKSTQFFCLSTEAYPGVCDSRKSVIHLDRNSILVQEMAKKVSLKNKLIWIEDSFSRVYKMPDQLYRDAIYSTLDYLKESTQISTIYLKLRPSQLMEGSIVYNILTEMNYEVDVLDNETLIEALLVNSENCTVIGNVSSVLFYAPLMRHKSISMFNQLKDKPNTAFDDFQVFWKNIYKI